MFSKLEIDFLYFYAIIKQIAKQIYLRGACCSRLRLDLVVLTREPDTVSTVVGKDAHMRYLRIALHLDGFAMR